AKSPAPSARARRITACDSRESSKSICKEITLQRPKTGKFDYLSGLNHPAHSIAFKFFTDDDSAGDALDMGSPVKKIATDCEANAGTLRQKALSLAARPLQVSCTASPIRPNAADFCPIPHRRSAMGQNRTGIARRQ